MLRQIIIQNDEIEKEKGVKTEKDFYEIGLRNYIGSIMKLK